MDSVRSEAPPHILFEGVHMAFDDRVVHRSLSCSFARGRISVILGGSGSGKSTLLRLIGGLVRPDAGRILVAGSDVTRLSDDELFDVRSRLGMLFQHGALLDSLTVFDNLALPLRGAGSARKRKSPYGCASSSHRSGSTTSSSCSPGSSRVACCGVPRSRAR